MKVGNRDLSLKLSGKPGELSGSTSTKPDDEGTKLKKVSLSGARLSATFAGESLGVDAYMLKPVPLGMLLNKAADLLDARDEADGLIEEE